MSAQRQLTMPKSIAAIIYYCQLPTVVAITPDHAAAIKMPRANKTACTIVLHAHVHVCGAEIFDATDL